MRRLQSSYPFLQESWPISLLVGPILYFYSILCARVTIWESLREDGIHNTEMVLFYTNLEIGIGFFCRYLRAQGKRALG